MYAAERSTLEGSFPEKAPPPCRPPPPDLATLDVRIIRRRAGRVTDAFLETVLAALRKKFTR
jgi:hypothetical protein